MKASFSHLKLSDVEGKFRTRASFSQLQLSLLEGASFSHRGRPSFGRVSRKT